MSLKIKLILFFFCFLFKNNIIFSQNEFIIRVNTAVGTGSGSSGGNSNQATPSGQFFLRDAQPTTGVTIVIKEITGTTTLHTYNNVSAGHLINNADWSGTQTQYQIEYSNNITSFQLANNGDKLKITSIEQWGNATWSSFSSALHGCSNLTSVSTVDNPDLSSVSSLDHFFNSCSSLTGGNFNNWNTSNIVNMNGLFYGCINFNQNLNNWNTSNVVNMSNVFNGATSFNGNITTWDVGSVTTFQNMFGNPFVNNAVFNQALNSWGSTLGTNTGTNSINMSQMFIGCTSFNQDLNNWNTEYVDNMSGLFMGANSFNSNIDNWDVGRVTNFSQMFGNQNTGNSNFNRNISSWNVGANTGNTAMNLSEMFGNCTSFNQNLCNWNVEDVTNFFAMFRGATSYNNSSNSLNCWDVSDAVNMGHLFMQCNYNLSLNSWCSQVVGVTDMSYMFYSNTVFNQNIGCWDVSTVNAFNSMFAFASNFNQDLSSWDVSNATDFSAMFNGASSYTNNGVSLNTWSPNSALYLNEMFKQCAYNMPLDNNWCGSTLNGVLSMTQMFNNNFSFNQDISCWDVSTVNNFNGMFYGAINYSNSGVSLNVWNPVSAINMSDMFRQCAYNRPLNNNWCGSTLNGVTNMANMFLSNNVFNQDISCWDVSTVTDMRYMFSYAFNFNNNGTSLSSWNTANVINMSGQFWYATSFNQDIGNWTLHPNVNLQFMLNDCGMNCNSYSNTLIGWANNNSSVTNKILGANGCKYNNAAITYRTQLTTTQSWTINNDALLGNQAYVVPNNTNMTGNDTCDAYFIDPANPTRKLISINPNGNTINLSNFSLTVSNNSVPSLPSGVSYVSASNTGYYQINDASNTFRVSRRLFTINGTGTYNTNGGVLVRLYFNDEDTSNIITDVLPSGSLMKQGWFKSSLNNAQDVVNNMQSSFPSLSSAQEISNVSYGIETGIRYVEFLVNSFSTFGFYIQSELTPLPVHNYSFQIQNKCNEVELKWKNNDEEKIETYEIEKSKDGKKWKSIGKINSENNLAKENNYVFIDKNTENEQALYYRIKLIKQDKDFIYSEVKMLETCENNNYTLLNISPNPMTNTLKINSNTPLKKITITDIHGKIVHESNIDLKATELDITMLKAGIYYLYNYGTTYKLIKL